MAQKMMYGFAGWEGDISKIKLAVPIPEGAKKLAFIQLQRRHKEELDGLQLRHEDELRAFTWNLVEERLRDLNRPSVQAK